MGRGLYRVNPSRSFDFLSSSCKKKGFEKYHTGLFLNQNSDPDNYRNHFAFLRIHSTHINKMVNMLIGRSLNVAKTIYYFDNGKFQVGWQILPTQQAHALLYACKNKYLSIQTLLIATKLKASILTSYDNRPLPLNLPQRTSSPPPSGMHACRKLWVHK